MKKSICIVLSICILLTAAVIVLAKAITLSDNGEVINMYPHPIIKNERTFTIADSFRSLNCTVTEIEYFEVVILQKGNKKIFVKADTCEYFVFEGTAKEFENKVNEGITASDKKCFEEAPFIENFLFYIPVREVCEELGYEVSWENNIREVTLTSSKEVSEQENTDYVFTREIKEYFERLEKIKLGLLSDARYKEGSFDYLCKYNIVEESDEEYITYREALRAFATLLGEDGSHSDLSDWYAIDEFEVLDDKINDDDKVLLLSIMEWRYILTRDDILSVDMDGLLTEGDALTFAVRSVGDTYSCTDYPVEMDYTTCEQVYCRACEKELWTSDNIENCNAPIKRYDFYELMNKVLFSSYASGGYAGVSYVRHINFFDREETAAKEWTVTSEEIEVPIKNDNLNFSWIKPEFVTNDYFMSIDLLNDKGEEKGYSTSGRPHEKIADTEIIEMILRNNGEKLSKLKVTYSLSDWTNRERAEYCFYIDLSFINVIHEGTPPTPDIYYRNKGQWPVKKLSLKEGEVFEEGKFYVIAGKETKYRKEEFNSTSYSVFRARKTENTVTDFGTTGSFGTNYGDVRLMVAEIDMNTVRISAISEATFTKQEL